MLVEREAPLERLRALATQAAGGAGSCLVIEGGAGIGKTALLHELQKHAADLGLRTLTATGADLEREHAFGVARQLLTPAWRAASEAERAELLDGAASLALPLLDLTHENPGGAGAAETQSILYGTHWLLATLAEKTPLMLVVDDAHWADEPSITLLEYLARRVAEMPVLLVIGKRPPAPGTANLIHPGETMRLEPLSREGVAQMAELLSETAETADLAAACHEATGGNPLYVYAVLSELRDRGLEQQAKQAVADLGPEPVARSVDRRLSELPPAAAATAEALAILGDDATLLDVAELAEIETSQAAAGADALVRAGILARGDRLAFAHPVVRATITGRIGDHEQGLRHARAASQRMRATLASIRATKAGASRVSLSARFISRNQSIRNWSSRRACGGGRPALRRPHSRSSGCTARFSARACSNAGRSRPSVGRSVILPAKNSGASSAQ